LKYTDNILVDNVITDLKSKLSRKGDIKLCTIHKSKGLEHNTVYLLNENLIPSKFALTEEALVQEQNIRYVARTRSKENLYLLNLKDTENE
jgi:DNA helicase-2/ATP-dependent DNA helicase PcrA